MIKDDLHDFEVEELLRDILEFDDDISFQEVQNKLNADHSIDFDQFKTVTALLLNYAHVSKSPLTNTLYVGFANHHKRLYFIKREIK